MADQYEVLCISRSGSDLNHERITHIGGKNSEGGKWRITQEKAIDGILNNELEFYMAKNGKTIKIIVAGPFGKKYLKSENDPDSPLDLLGLPDC
ncbi:MAG: DUF3892 domain-containing protein [Bacteroidota bacterium]